MPSGHLPRLNDQDFRFLQRLMLEESGIRMAEQKRTLVAGRLMGRLRSLQLQDYSQYLQLLNRSEERR